MDRRNFIERIQAQRKTLGLSHQAVADRAGLSEKSVRNALHPLGNPRLSSLMAVLDALALEMQLVPQGFGPADGSEADVAYRPVRTLVESAVHRKPAD